MGVYSPKLLSIAINGENLEGKKASVVKKKKVSENKFDLRNCLSSKISQCLNMLIGFSGFWIRDTGRVSLLCVTILFNRNVRIPVP